MGRSKQEYLPDEEYDDGTPPVKGKKRVHRWNEVDTLVYPHAMQKALNVLGIAMPWEEIAEQMRNGQSGGALSQHMAKDYASLKEQGVRVPSPLKRGGKRTSRYELDTIPRLAPVATKVSKTAVNNLSQSAKDKRERQNFKRNPPKLVQRDDTPPPHPRKNGQYPLACALMPRAMPAFAQRELRPYPPPLLVEPSDPAIDYSQGPPSSGPSAPALNRPLRPRWSGPSAPAVNGPPPSPLAARQESLSVSVEETHTSPDPEPAQETTDLSGIGQVEEVTDPSDFETVQETTDPSGSGSEPAQEPVHEPPSIFSEMVEQSNGFDPEPEPELTCENFFRGLAPWIEDMTSTWYPHAHTFNANNAMMATAHNPYHSNGYTMNPAVFLESEMSRMLHDMNSSR